MIRALLGVAIVLSLYGVAIHAGAGTIAARLDAALHTAHGRN